jgi:drug/metabolite transporter (DMT)-like permease
VVSRKQWLALGLLGVIWGTTWVASGALAESVPPLRVAAVRFLLAALFWIPVILWKRLSLPRGRILGFVFLLSVTLIVLPLLLLLWAQQHASSATITVLYAAMPLLVSLLTPRGVPSGAMQAAIVGLGAIILVVGAGFSVAQAAGAAVGLLAVASAGNSALVVRAELRTVNPLVLTALVLGNAAWLLFLASLALERGQPAQWDRNAIGSVLFLALVAGAPAYALDFWLLQQLEAYKVVTVQWIGPLVGILETAFFLRVRLSFTMVAASLVTLASLLVVMRASAEDDNTVSLLGN